jgi:hypothetical protein
VPEGRVIAIGAVGVGVLGGACIACRCASPPALADWAALSGLGFATAALAPPGRARDGLVFGGAMVGVLAAMLAGGATLAAGLVFATLAVAAGRQPALGPVVSGAPLFYGALAAGRATDGALPWILVSWLWGLRGLLPTRASPEWRAWLAAGLALAYVPASLVLPSRGAYSGYYYLTVLFADLVLLLVATRLLVGQAERLTGLVTAAIGVSIAALVVGRVL